MTYSMYLNDEEKEILQGKHGETLKKVMATVVMYGETFGAKRLVPVSGSSHLVTSMGIPLLKPVFKIMDELIDNKLVVEDKFTVDPRPIDYENVKCSLIEKIAFKVMYGKQKDYEEQLKKVGLRDSNSFTCTCYLDEVANTPKKGDILSWAESSAVVYANSVLGAKCNRNSGIIEMFGAILGKVPEFDLLTHEGRKAKWVIELKTDKLPEAHVLGSAIGMKVMEDVPYIKGLDKFLGNELNDFTKSYLKDMGAASASNGAVGLYHVENLTPEAVEQGKKLLLENAKTYIIDDVEIDRVIYSYPVMWENKDAVPKLCFIGCPHLSMSQIYYWIDLIEKKLKENNSDRIKIRTVMTAAPDVVKKFKEDKESYEKLLKTGVKMSSICPLMYMNNPVCAKKPVITNSNKLRTYTSARYYKDEKITDTIVKGS